jgi:lysine 6-dehydrogenase
MKVLALGGVGAVALEATRDLVEFSNFDEIIIADDAVDKARHLAAEIGDSRLRVERLDANDYDDLLRLIGSGIDVVMNGLPFKYDLAVNKACVELGVPGVDLSSEDPQFKLHPEAEHKGILFIPGCGATPGITNVMARRGIEQLDRVEEIQISFAAFRCLAPAPGLLTTTFYEFMPLRPDRVRYEDGQYIEMPSFSGARRVEFHDQIGEQTVYHVPHDETWTLSQNVPGVRRVEVHGCFPPQVMALMRGMLAAGLFNETPIAFYGRKTSPSQILHDLLLQLPETKQNDVWAYGLVVEVRGWHKERRVNYTYSNAHPSQEVWGGPAAYFKQVGIPLSIATQMLAEGRCQGTGVRPPELAIPSQPFFEELARRGIKVYEQMTESGVLV